MPFQKAASYYQSDRKDLLSLIPAQQVTSVLDIGCGAGEGWKGTSFETYGIERDAAAAALARAHMKAVAQGALGVDLSLDQALTALGKREFDALVLADVLEHMYDPWGQLKSFARLLKPGGLGVFSIPNLRYYRVMRPLVFGGEFRYRDSGVLDIDHIRFFTRKSMLRMIREAGFEVVTVRGRVAASFKQKLLNILCLGLLSDFLVEQYYVIARKN